MIHEVQLGRSCDSLRLELERELALGVTVQRNAFAMVEAQKAQIAFRDEAAKVQASRVVNYAKDNQELRKEVRRQKRKAVLIGIGAVVAIVLVAL